VQKNCQMAMAMADIIGIRRHDTIRISSDKGPSHHVFLTI
jgi:hypothetical protein